MRDLVEQKVADPVASTMEINSGQPGTPSRTVTITSDVTKENDVLEMRLKNDTGDWSSWVEYSKSVEWTLSDGDGVKTVYIEVRDQGHHVVSLTNTIILDTTVPVGGFKVRGTNAWGGPDTHINTASAVLFMNVTGAYYMRFNNEGGPWSGWQPYAPSRLWTLSAGDGAKTVNAEFSDIAYNPVLTPLHNIILDTTAPSVSGFAINSNDTTTNNANVTLGYNYTETNSVMVQYINDGGSWSAMEDPAGSPVSRAWSLVNVNGTRTVSVRLTDIAGNVSAVSSDTIYLNTVAPDAPLPSAATPTNDATPTWSWAAVAGASQYRVQLDGTGGTWINVAGSLSWTPSTSLADGSHTLYVQAADVAGNWSGSGSRTVIIDTLIPGAPQSPVCSEASDGWISYLEEISGIDISINLSGTGAVAGDLLNLMFNGTSFSVSSLTASDITSGQYIFTNITSLGTDGIKNVTARITDQAGNTGDESSALVFTLDSVIPAVPSFTVTPSINTTDNTPAWEWGIVVGASVYEIRLDSVTVYSADGTTYTSPAMAEGSHSYTIRSGDAAGNWSAWRTAVTFTIDYTAPSVTGNSLAYQASTLWGFGATITWNPATDNTTAQQFLQYRLVFSLSPNIDTPVNANNNGTAIMGWTNNVTSFNANMLNPSTTYYFNVIARDAAGNESVFITLPMTTAVRPIMLFGTSATYNGNLGGRTGADQKVQSEYNASLSSRGYSSVRCFISVNSADEIRDMPANYSIPTDVPVYGPNGTKIANSWSELLLPAASILSTLYQAGAASSSAVLWWSGSINDGSLFSQNCNGWTDTTAGCVGGAGVTNITGTNNWIWQMSTVGTSSFNLVGVAFN